MPQGIAGVDGPKGEPGISGLTGLPGKDVKIDVCVCVCVCVLANIEKRFTRSTYVNMNLSSGLRAR